jgi:hydroxymethylpyrimidine/phosphomethylpyrimidine kinase
LARRETVELVARRLESRARGIPIVLDPVMRSTSGVELLSVDGVQKLVERLLPQAALVTPNAAEAGYIAGLEVTERKTMQHAADELLLRGASAVLITGGDLEGDTVVDLLRTVDGIETWFEGPRIETRSSHGTGCTLSSAIAVGLAEGLTLEGAIERARRFVAGALGAGLPFGGGVGPVDHGWQLRAADGKVQESD